MTDVNQTPDTNPTPEADKPADNTTHECRWHNCRPFDKQHWQWRCGKKKAIVGIVLIALLAFLAGRGCSHHHEHWRMGHAGQYGQPTVTQPFNGEVQQMPLSTVLDGIAATPEQRAKAVELLH